MPCSHISADWASQRIKGLSLWKAIFNAFQGQAASTAKTLVDEFEYPRLGAGMMWEKTRDDLVQKGCKVMMGRTVTQLERDGNRVVAANTESPANGRERWTADEFIVSMPLRDCVLGMEPSFEAPVLEAARKLSYRDFILVALLVNRRDVFPDNWIYVHEPEVKVARIENFNNWGGGNVPDASVTCLELEYFCSQGDAVWEMSDAEIAALARGEVEQLGLVKGNEILDSCVVRIEKAYPVYDHSYQANVGIIRQALANLSNLQVAGRNAMHKYNNQDHSMLTGMMAARNLNGDRFDVWRVNTDAEYLEAGPTTEDTGRLVPRSKQP
jgi:protoporphyrinogen oxidase